jgi:hypothetical protein
MIDTGDLQLKLGSTPQEEEEEVLIYYDHLNRWQFRPMKRKIWAKI